MDFKAREKWKSILVNYHESKLPVAEFCKIEKVSKTCFYKWKKIFEDENQLDMDDINSFIEIKSSKTINSAAEVDPARVITITTSYGLKLEVPV